MAGARMLIRGGGDIHLLYKLPSDLSFLQYILTILRSTSACFA